MSLILTRTCELSLTTILTVKMTIVIIVLAVLSWCVGVGARFERLPVIPPDKLAQVGQSVRLVCAGGIGGKSVVAWYKDGALFPRIPSARVTTSGNTLTLDPVAMGDAGKYGCLVTDPTGHPWVNVTLTVSSVPPLNSVRKSRDWVKGEPHFTKSKPEITVQRVYTGGIIQLACPARGVPKPDIEWYKNGITLSGNIRVAHRKWGMRINYVVIGDEGNYTCVVSNGVGEMSWTYEIIVYPWFPIPPTEATPNDNKTIGYGETETFECGVDGDRRSLIHHNWLKHVTVNGSYMNDFGVSRVQILRTSLINETDPEELVVGNVTMEDTGWYTCFLGNEHGISHKSVWLTVLPKPDEITPSPEITNATVTKQRNPSPPDGETTKTPPGHPDPMRAMTMEAPSSISGDKISDTLRPKSGATSYNHTIIIDAAAERSVVLNYRTGHQGEQGNAHHGTDTGSDDVTPRGEGESTADVTERDVTTDNQGEQGKVDIVGSNTVKLTTMRSSITVLSTTESKAFKQSSMKPASAKYSSPTVSTTKTSSTATRLPQSGLENGDSEKETVTTKSITLDELQITEMNILVQKASGDKAEAASNATTSQATKGTPFTGHMWAMIGACVAGIVFFPAMFICNVLSRSLKKRCRVRKEACAGRYQLPGVEFDPHIKLEPDMDFEPEMTGDEESILLDGNGSYSDDTSFLD